MITFKNSIDETKLRMAYNNDVIHFYSTLSSTPQYCDITLGTAALRLYPAPDGTFRLNLKPYVTALINTRNFEDTLNPSLQAVAPSDFVYNFTNGTYYAATLTLTIWLTSAAQDSDTYELAWLAGAEQLGDYRRYSKSEYFVLSPLKKDSTMHYYLKYWEGYPFDISLYTPSFKYFYIKGDVMAFYNATFLNQYRVARLVVSDGRTDVSLENILPLIEGYNELRYKSNIMDNIKDKFITLHKVPCKEGVYLKWLNKYGGYSYWLFENTYAIDRSTKYTGELDRDFANLEQMQARSVQIGKESQDTMKIIAELLNDDERRIVEGILDSPKIYLFTGKPLSRNSKKDWIEVTLKTTNSRIKNSKQQLTNLSFDIELPPRFTQSL